MSTRAFAVSHDAYFILVGTLYRGLLDLINYNSTEILLITIAVSASKTAATLLVSVCDGLELFWDLLTSVITCRKVI